MLVARPFTADKHAQEWRALTAFSSGELIEGADLPGFLNRFRLSQLLSGNLRWLQTGRSAAVTS